MHMRIPAVLMLIFAARAFAEPLDLTAERPFLDAEPQQPRTYTISLADRFSYDDNLFRIPSENNVAALVGPGASRQDLVNTVSLGLDGRWYAGSQAISIDLHVDDNRFVNNDDLNNVSGKAALVWDWRLGGNLSGQAGANYYRALASFANTNYYARDMVEREDYFGNARFQIGPSWTLLAGVDVADTSLSAVSQQLFDFHSKSGNAGIEYASPADNTLTLEYRYTDARFPQVFVLNGAPFNSDYNEDTARVSIKYAFTAVTLLEASAGYLKRDYPYSSFAAFSGAIGRASLQWQPAYKLQFVLTGWRELKAYVDSESDYFVSTGASIAPQWTLTEQVSMSLGTSWEKHDYIGSSPSALTLLSRHDKLISEQARVAYKPIPTLAVELTYRFDRRDSNRAEFNFDDMLAAVGVTYKFGR